MAVKLVEYSAEIKAALNKAGIDWLYTWSAEIASQAQRNCKMDGDTGVQLRNSYTAQVDESDKKATIGTPLEAGYWEEFGTGSHAVNPAQGRKGWWVYTPGNPGPTGYKSNVYMTEDEAQTMAAWIKAKYGMDAVATNGREPQHTLENAFKVTLPKAKADLPHEVNEELGDT